MACGQCGLLVVGDVGERPWPALSDLFKMLLVLNEERGPYATGLGIVRAGGESFVLKEAVPATQFLEEPKVRKALRQIGDEDNVLLGHCRWPTGGGVENIANNHPIVAGTVLGTHNGWVGNADDLFDDLGLEREGAVDSEVIFRIADEAIRRDDFDYYLKNIRLCHGPIAAVWISVEQPDLVYLTRIKPPFKPLEIVYAEDLGIIVYSSHFMQEALEANETLAAYRWDWFEMGIGTWRVNLNSGDMEFLGNGRLF